MKKSLYSDVFVAQALEDAILLYKNGPMGFNAMGRVPADALTPRVEKQRRAASAIKETEHGKAR